MSGSRSSSSLPGSKNIIEIIESWNRRREGEGEKSLEFDQTFKEVMVSEAARADEP